jgi:hypothetical protein
MPDSPVILNKRNYRAAFGDFDASGDGFVWPDEARLRRRRLIYAILGVTAVFFVAGAASTLLVSFQPRSAPSAINASAAALERKPAPAIVDAEAPAATPAGEQSAGVQSEGVTVLPRIQEEKKAATAPVQQAAAIDEQPSNQAQPVTAGELGYAIELGGARSFSELSRRFAAIADANQEIAFDRMEPRVTLADTATGVEARLLVGPFDSLVDAEETCAQIALPSGIGCRPTGFAGEVIARQ